MPSVLADTPDVCKVSGHLLEFTWGYLLGEPSNFTCRKDGWGVGGKELSEQVMHGRRLQPCSYLRGGAGECIYSKHVNS